MGTTQYELLGPLTVRRFGVAMALDSPELARLLAALLLESNDGVPVGRLTEAVWGYPGPPDAAMRLEELAEKLRDLVDPQQLPGQAELLIHLSNGGYVLCVEPADTDLGRFLAEVQQATDLRTAGHPGDAAARLRSALSLWKGEPLAGLQGFEAARANMQQARAMAQAQLADTEREAAYRSQDVAPPPQPQPQPPRQSMAKVVALKFLATAVCLGTVGLASWIVLGTVAIRRRSLALGISALVYLALAVLFYWLYPADQDPTGGELLLAFLYLLSIPTAAIQAAVVVAGKNSVGAARQTS
jgi:hypothetical protein